MFLIISICSETESVIFFFLFLHNCPVILVIYSCCIWIWIHIKLPADWKVKHFMFPSIRLAQAHCMSAHVINNINTSYRQSRQGYDDARTVSPLFRGDYLLRNTPHGAKYFTNRTKSGSGCLIVHQGWLPANHMQPMSFQTTADLEPLSSFSRRAEGWGRGIVIGQTKDDITGMILVIYWKWPTGCMASSFTVAPQPIVRLLASYSHFIHLIKPIQVCINTMGLLLL